MFKLIKNEYSKLLRRRASQILILLLLLAAAGLAFFFHLPFVQSDASYETIAESSAQTEEEKPSPEQLRHEQTEAARIQYDALKANKDAGIPVDQAALDKAESTYLEHQYIEDHDLDYTLTFDKDYGYAVTDSLLIRTLNSAPMLMTLIALVMIVFAGGIIANETSQGTIKFLLINPVRRGKILWSKYLCCLSLLVFLTFLLFGLEILLLGISYGFSGYAGEYVHAANGAAAGTPILLYGFQQFMLAAVNPLLMMTMAFAISSLFRSSALSIALGLGGLLGGSVITSLLSELGIDWGRYLVFSNTGLSAVAQGSPPFPGQTLTFSIFVLAIYMGLFLLTAYDGFTRREV